MNAPLLVDFFNSLPEDALQGALDGPVSRHVEQAGKTGQATEKRTGGKAKRRAAIHIFCKQVQQKYTEGTLIRLLATGGTRTRRASAFALGMLGSPAVNEILAAHLHDEDDEVARLAGEALWTLWFRGDSPAHSDELYRILRQPDRQQALDNLGDLIRRAPCFAEAYNQRAILHFRVERYSCSAADCEAVLRLEPNHFGAQAGLAQCLLRLGKQKAALRAFRISLRINPRQEGVAELIRNLEETLGNEGRE